MEFVALKKIRAANIVINKPGSEAQLALYKNTDLEQSLQI